MLVSTADWQLKLRKPSTPGHQVHGECCTAADQVPLSLSTALNCRPPVRFSEPRLSPAQCEPPGCTGPSLATTPGRLHSDTVPVTQLRRSPAPFGEERCRDWRGSCYARVRMLGRRTRQSSNARLRTTGKALFPSTAAPLIIRGACIPTPSPVVSNLLLLVCGECTA